MTVPTALVLAVVAAAGLARAQDLVNLGSSLTCSPEGKFLTLNISTKYLIFTLDGKEEQEVPKSCQVTVRAFHGTSIMVYLEKMYLRGGGEAGCVDYVQFGEDDSIPFVTINKSKKLCGNVEKWNYNVGVNKDLLIWVRVGKNRPENYRETLAVINLKLVITPFHTRKKNRGLERCGAKDRWIQRDFFCDNEVNCPTDRPGPYDESRERCSPTTTTAPPPSTTMPFPTTQTEYINIGFESEDLRLGTIISVSLGVLVGLVCCVRRCSKVSEPATPTSEEACQEMSQSQARSAFREAWLGRGDRPAQTSGHTPAMDYRMSGLPISSTQPTRFDPRRPEDSRGGRSSHIVRTPEPASHPADQPPPSYDDIFPDGFVYKKVEQDESVRGGEQADEEDGKGEVRSSAV